MTLESADQTTNTYLYGIGRIGEQQPMGWQYHLGDALGSVRQLTDATGTVTLSRRYEPYGELLTSAGSATSSYSFKGEGADSYTQFIYLRFRYYAPQFGRFISKDAWPGDYTRPLSLNGWNYVEANPIIFIDPSGHIKEGGEAVDATNIIEDLFKRYSVRIQKDFGYVTIQVPDQVVNAEARIVTWKCVQAWYGGSWEELDELDLVKKAIEAMGTAMGGEAKFKSAFLQKDVKLTRLNISKKPVLTINGKQVIGPIRGFAPPSWVGIGDIALPDYFFSRDDLYAKYSVVHELAHVWDRRSGKKLSKGISAAAGTKWVCGYQGLNCKYDLGLARGNEEPPGRPGQYNYAGKNEMEDWAESFATYVYPAYYSQYLNFGYWQLGPIRRKYVEDTINSIP